MGRIGLLAGKGSLPRMWAQRAREQGREIVVLSLASPAEEKALQPYVETIYPLCLGDWQGLIALLKKEGLNTIVPVGSFDKRILLQGLLKDLRLLKVLGSLGRRGDGDIIKALQNDLEKEGIQVVSQMEMLADHLLQPGFLTPDASPCPELEKDLDLAFTTALGLSRLGVGQVVLVKDGVVVACEALEGTNATIGRAGKLVGPGLVMAKVSWPQGREGWELPGVGLETIRQLARQKVRGLILQSRGVLLIEGEEVLKAAHRSGILVVAREGEA